MPFNFSDGLVYVIIISGLQLSFSEHPPWFMFRSGSQFWCVSRFESFLAAVWHLVEPLTHLNVAQVSMDARDRRQQQVEQPHFLPVHLARLLNGDRRSACLLSRGLSD